MKKFGTYHIIRQIGEGGMGVVYLGEDPMLHRKVAIKLIHQHNIKDEELKQRFLSEARLTAKLQHQNIATLYNLTEQDNDLAMVMEYLEGINLDDLLKKYKPLPYGLAKGIILQVLKGLGFAHEHGIIHRDIKPSNIMITKSGVVKILDFGIARMQGTSRLTQTGKMVGTLHYMAPEQILGKETTPQSDLYSTGIMLYEMLTGEPPFSGQSDYQLMEAQVNTSPNLSVIDNTSGMASSLKKALKKEGRQRFNSAENFAETLSLQKGERPYSSAEIKASIFGHLGEPNFVPPQIQPNPILKTGSGSTSQIQSGVQKMERLPSWLPILLFGMAGIFFLFVIASQLINNEEKIIAPDIAETIEQDDEIGQNFEAKRSAYLERIQTPQPVAEEPEKKVEQKESTSIPENSDETTQTTGSNKIIKQKEVPQKKEPETKTTVIESAIKSKEESSSEPETILEPQKSNPIIPKEDKPTSSSDLKAKSTGRTVSMTIPKNTPLVIALQSEISSETARDEMTVKFKSVKGLTVDGVEVVKPGELVYAKVDKVRASEGRKSGRLEIEVLHTTSVGGDQIPLYGVFYENGRGNSPIIHQAGKQFQVIIKSSTQVKAYKY